MQIGFPKGAFSASDSDTLLDRVMRKIAVAASPGPKEQWAEKYGADYENDVFMMHHF